MSGRRLPFSLGLIGALLFAGVWVQRTTRRDGGLYAQEPPSQAQQDSDAPKAQFARAGVCSRCHVNVVLEWGISGHVEAGTACQKCHGASKAHVANERNEIPPDRLPRGPQIAELCSSCHLTGCPETLELDSCSTCHHVHALIDPDTEGKDLRDELGEQLKAVLAAWNRYKQYMAEGEGWVHKENWKNAADAYRKALNAMPGKREARERIAYCLRRQNPEIPGMRPVTERIDPRTGLPSEMLVEPPGIRMALVPGGQFDMGDERYPQSQPVHTVSVDAFYLGCFEVTQAQWQRIMGANPSHHQGDRFPNASQMPVEQVSWNDALEFVERLNAQVPGGGFRLPTEAEWEFACRAGGIETGPEAQDAPPNPLDEIAWYRGNSRLPSAEHKEIVDLADFAPRGVGKKTGNPWGFHDLRGNVAEWCSSLYWPYLYQASDGREAIPSDGATNGTAGTVLLPTNWPNGMRVVRGGGYADSADYCQPALRHANRPDRRFRWLGFRLARSIPEVPIPGE